MSDERPNREFEIAVRTIALGQCLKSARAILTEHFPGYQLVGGSDLARDASAFRLYRLLWDALSAAADEGTVALPESTAR